MIDNVYRPPPPPPPPPPKPKPKPRVEPPKPKREARSSSFQAQKKPKVDLHGARGPKAERARTPKQAVDHVERARHAYDESKGRVKELDTRLAGEMHKLGPALTTEQKKAYTQKFHEKYQDDYDAEERDAKRLADSLKDPMLDKAVQRDPHAAYTAAEGAKSLAGSSRSADAVRWAVHALSPSNPASANYRKVAEPDVVPGPRGMGVAHPAIDIENDVVAPSLSNAAGQLVTENDGDVKGAIDDYSQMLGDVKSVGMAPKEVAQGQQLLAKVRTAVDAGQLASLRPGDFVDVSNTSKLGKGIAGAGLAFAALGAGDSASQGDYAQLAQSIADTGRGGVELLTKTLDSLNGAGRIAGTDGLRAATFLDRLAPGIGVVANALQLGIDSNDLADDPSVGGAVTVLGDSIALAGAGIGTVLPGVGQMVEVVGVAVSSVGQLITGNKEKHELEAEEQQLLVDSNLDPRVAGVLAHSDDQANMLHDQLKMSPLEIQRLAKNNAELFDAPGYAQAAMDSAKAMGLEKADANGFFEAMKKEDSRYVDFLFTELEGRGTNQAVYADTLRKTIASKYPGATAFARAHSPDSFGPDAEARQRAQRDIESVTADPPAITNLLESNDEPAYRAELVRQLKDKGLLDTWTKQLGGAYHYNGWPETGAEAVRAAQSEGVLSKAEADRYLAQIG